MGNRPNTSIAVMAHCNCHSFAVLRRRGWKHPSSTVDDHVLYSVYDDELTTAVAIDEILTLVITVVRPFRVGLDIHSCNVGNFSPVFTT